MLARLELDPLYFRGRFYLTGAASAVAAELATPCIAVACERRYFSTVAAYD